MGLVFAFPCLHLVPRILLQAPGGASTEFLALLPDYGWALRGGGAG